MRIAGLLSIFTGVFSSNGRSPDLEAPEADPILSDGRENNSNISARIRRQGLTVWMTGLSGSGKTTIAAELEEMYPGRIFRLDGDNLRKGLNRDLGFSDEDRRENNRRTAEVAKIMNAGGMIVICALIAPFAADRKMARQLHEESNLSFFEVFVDAPLEVVERRDPKNLYKRARAGVIKNFTGISAAYEPPENPDVHIQTDKLNLENSVKLLLSDIRKQQLMFMSDDECELKRGETETIKQ